MSEGINPEMADPATTQGFEQSDRNPQVTQLGGAEADGGPIAVPAANAGMDS